MLNDDKHWQAVAEALRATDTGVHAPLPVVELQRLREQLLDRRKALLQMARQLLLEISALDKMLADLEDQ